MRRRKRQQNPIWLAVGIVLIILLSIHSIRGNVVSSVALEQRARCGGEEPLHESACYVNGVLRCGQAAHTHNRNCYLVLLRENDVDQLLTQMDTVGTHSLETLIHQSVSEVYYNGGSDGPATSAAASAAASAILLGEGADLSASSIAALNATISQSSGAEQMTASLVFNENLYDASNLSDSPGDTILAFAPVVYDPGVSTLSVGEDLTAETDNYQANLYVQLDGTWSLIGTTTFSVGGSRNSYYARMTTSDFLAFVNGELETDYTRTQLRYSWATSYASDEWSSLATPGSTYTYFGTGNSQQSTARRAKFIRLYDSYGNPISYYTVTYHYPDGTSSAVYVPTGDTVILPADAQWTDQNGTVYSGGDTVEIYETTTFTGWQTDGKLRIRYDIAFPTVDDVVVDTEPTLAGTYLQTLTEAIEDGSSAVARNVSQQEVWGKIDGNSADLSRVIRFRGWQVNDTDTVISANATLTWAELQAYAVNNTVRLTALWDYRPEQTASFYIRYDSVAMDTEGNQTSGAVTDYTPELFATHVGGETGTLGWEALNEKYYIADTSADNSYGADKEIRALYGADGGDLAPELPGR